MEQYIPKAALVAEIEKLVKDAEIYLKYNSDDDSLYEMYKHQKAMMLDLLNKVDAFEVKEVDLEKHLKEDIEDALFDLNGVAVKGATHYITVEDVKDIAKYFFELGMAASNKAQKGE